MIDQEEYNILSQYGKEAKSFERINFKEEKRLSKLIQKGDIGARDKLVTSNLKLVMRIASFYKDRGISYADLVSEGNRGLVLAANKYDYKIGTRFSTYAYWQIKEAITTSLKNENKWFNVIEHDYMFDPMAGGCKEHLASEEQNACIVTDKISGASINIFNDDENEKDEEDNFNDEYSDVIMYLVELSPRECEIIKHYYGIEDHDELNVTELSKMYKISNMRVSKIIDESIRKIRCKYLSNSEN